MKNIDLLVDTFEEALLQVDRIKAEHIFKECYAGETSFGLVEKFIIRTLDNIGSGWENGVVSLSQVYMSGVICEELVEEYFFKLDLERVTAPKMAIAVLQDHHSLGKMIVHSVLRAGGFELMDFGQGLSTDELAQKTMDNNIEILLISTLMLPSALKVKEVKEKLSANKFSTKIIVGGAPFRLDNKLWGKVNADATGDNGTEVLKILQLLTKKDCL